jgi:hypothetical protein
MSILQFYWKCAKYALRGSWGVANSASAVIGGLILVASTYLLGLNMQAPTSFEGVLAFGAVYTLASVVAAWILIYIARFLVAPARLYQQLQATIPPPQASDISLNLLDRFGVEGGSKDTTGHELPHALLFLVRVTNIGRKLLQQCQVTFDSCLVSEHFDLRQGEDKVIPVLRVSHADDDPQAFVYFRDPDGKVIDGSRWLPSPSIYEIRVLSADTSPATLNVKLSVDRSSFQKAEWKLMACSIPSRSQGGLDAVMTLGQN